MMEILLQTTVCEWVCAYVSVCAESRLSVFVEARGILFVCMCVCVCMCLYVCDYVRAPLMVQTS